MKNTQIYLLTLNSPSQTALRLWTGRSLHTLRHCSVKQVGGALVEMQKNVDALQESMGILKQVKKQLTAVPASGVRETKQNAAALTLKQGPRFADQHSNRRTSKEVQQATIGRRQRHGGFFRNVGQKGGSQ
jgi:hypothetical protein